jgi:hypothetical protein
MNTTYLSIDADSISSKAPLVDTEIDRLFDSKSHMDKQGISGTPAGKAGKFQRPFAASFTMGQSRTNMKCVDNDISIPNLESRNFPGNYGVEELEDLEDIFEVRDELFPKKKSKDVAADLPMLTASAFRISLPSGRARYNFQLGLINTAEMLPETRSKSMSSPHAHQCCL